MAYRAEIEIGVKGVKQLDRFQSQLERLANEVDRVNKKEFTVANLSSYNEALRKANENLNQTQIETDKAGKATGLYKRNLDSFVTALIASNDAQDLNNKLVRQEIQDRGAATQALKAYNAELASATQRGSQTTMTGSYLRGQPKFGPEPAPGFDPIAGAARTRAAGLASEAIAEGKATQRLAQQKIELTNKVNQADRRAFIELNNDKIRGIQKRLDAEIDAIGTKLSAAIKADNAEGAKFDQELTRRIRLNTDAEKLYLKIREDSEKRIEAKRKAGLTAAKKLEQNIAKQRQDIATQRADRKARRDNAISSGLIGGAFPLLFGQGGGAAIGGGIGGFAGGLAGGQMGFALSLVGTQIGAFADQIVSGGATLGQALNPLTADIDALAEAAGFAGTETGKALKTIQELGSEQQALEAATALLAATVGNEGVQSLRDFGDGTADLSVQVSRSLALMQSAASKLFSGLVDFTVDALKNINDLSAGMNLDTPEAKELQTRRAELLGDGSGALGPGASSLDSLSPAQYTELVSIEDQLRELARGVTAEAEAQVQAAAKELRLKKVSSALGIKDAKLNEINTKLARQKTDYTNKSFVNLKRAAIIRERDIAIEKAIETVGRDENGTIKDRGQLRIKEGQIIEESITKQNQLARDVEEAFERQNKKIASGVKNTSRQNKQLLQQKQQASSLTATLDRQLAQSKVAGTVEAQKLAIEGRYEQTLERIAKLKDQSEASEQRKLAAQIKTNAEAKLAFDQEQKRAKALRDAVAPLKQIRDSQEANLAASKEYNRLIMEGVLPAEAKRIVEYNKQVAALILQKNELIKIAEAKLLSLDIDSEQAKALRQRIDDLKEERGLIEGKAAEGPGKGKSDKERIEDAIGDAQGELNKLIDPVNQVVAAAGAIGDAFSESFKGVISGSMSAQQALANLFQKTADHFLDMTAQIIAAAIKAQAIQFIGSIIGSTASAGPSPLNLDGIQQYVNTSPVLTKSLFAEGGYVSRPTNALIGEGGEPEYVIPESKMRTAMSRYSRGSRGNSVIPESGAAEAIGEGGGTAVAAPIDVRYTVERINSVDYVTADQFQAGMQQAAQQGAKQGEQQTLKRLQMSGSTRKRIGI